MIPAAALSAGSYPRDVDRVGGRVSPAASRALPGVLLHPSVRPDGMDRLRRKRDHDPAPLPEVEVVHPLPGEDGRERNPAIDRHPAERAARDDGGHDAGEGVSAGGGLRSIRRGDPQVFGPDAEGDLLPRTGERRGPDPDAASFDRGVAVLPDDDAVDDVLDPDEPGDLAGRGDGEDLPRCPHLRERSVHQDADPVGEPLPLIHIVGREDDRRAEVPVDPEDEAFDRRHRDRVEVRGRFVHQEDLGLDHHRPCKGHPLHLPARERPGPPLPVAGKPDRIEGLLDLRFDRCIARPPEPEPDGDVLRDRRVEDGRLLEDHPHHPPDGEALPQLSADVGAFDPDRSSRRGIEEVDEAQQGRFPGPGGPDDGKDLSPFHPPGDAGKHAFTVELFSNAFKFNHGSYLCWIVVMTRLTARAMTRRMIPSAMDSEIVEACLFSHETGIRVLPSPLRPEQAEIVTGRHVEAILSLLAESFDFLVIDLPQGLGDVSLTAMDASDIVYLITSLELPAIKNASMCLEIMDALGYDDDKVKLVVNRPSREASLDISEVEKTLKRTVDISIPNEGRLVTESVNKGVPFALSSPNAKISLAIKDLAKALDPQRKGEKAERGSVSRENASPSRRIASVFAGIFGFFIHG